MTQGREPRARGGRSGVRRPGRTPEGRRVGRSGAARRDRPGQPAAVRPRLTSRAAVLVLVVALLAVSYASSLRAYLQQRHEIDSLTRSIASSEADIAALRREKRRWHDPAYVVSQARARFAFGFPGEIGFRVLDAEGKPLDGDTSLSAPKKPDRPEWWQTTVTSIQVAAHPPTEDGPPATKITPPPRPKGNG